jgi:hypothetical protein
VHAYRCAVRIYLRDLNALNSRLTRTALFFDEISAAPLEREFTSRKVGTALGDRIGQLKGQALSVSILDDANNSRAFKVNIGDGSRHATNRYSAKLSLAQ